MPITEHLYPQIPKGELTAGIYKNYSSAQRYYAARRKLFRDYLERTLDSIGTNMDQSMTDMIEVLWNKNIYGVMQGIYNSGLKDGVSVAQMQKEVTSRFNLPPQVMNLLLRSVTYSGKQYMNFLADLGKAYEQWLDHIFKNHIINRALWFVSGHTNNLINSFVSGAMTSKASVVKGEQNIRPDILISPYVEIDFTKDNGILKTPTGLPVELQLNMNFDFENTFPKAEEVMSDKRILKDFLESGKGDIYGLSAKSWTNSDGKKFMESAIMRDSINAIFNKRDSHGFRHSWESDYTAEYVAYYLSHKIIDIISPTTVALTTRKGVIWMDDFLSQHMFYMQIQIEKFARKDRSKDTSKKQNLKRIFPQISNSNIYVRNYQMGKALNLLSTEHRTQKGTNHWIDLKITSS